jgi:hypothetical protein
MKTLLALCMLFPTFSVYGQEDILTKTDIKIGLNFSCSPHSGPFRFSKGGEDEPVLHGKEFYTAGIAGVFSISKKLAIESGVAYSNHTILVELWGPDGIGFIEEIPILYVPVALRYTFLKYAYLSGGLFFGFDFSDPGELTNQTGIGLSFGPGFNYEFRNGISMSVNPYINIHSWISYVYGPLNNDKIIEGSIKLGLFYRL